MLSSTSSSDTWTAQRGINILLSALAISYVLVELLAGLGFSHVSKIQRRISQEYVQALAIRPVENGKPTILLCGNSLLLEGVNLPVLQNHLASQYAVHRFVIESTEYLDWYFGLQRLFRQGMRPSYVVVLLTPAQLVHDTTRGEYFAYFLMSPRNILEVKKKARLDMTTASNYLLATQSPWLGAQSDIRKWFLSRLLPDFTRMTDALRPPPAAAPSDGEIRSVAPDRLATLQKICEQNGSQMLFVVPPQPEDARIELVQQGAASKNITVLAPYRTLPASDFSDGFHLNDIGNSLFTETLARDLPKVLGQRSTTR